MSCHAIVCACLSQSCTKLVHVEGRSLVRAGPFARQDQREDRMQTPAIFLNLVVVWLTWGTRLAVFRIWSRLER